MFDFYFNCYQESSNVPSLMTPIAQTTSAVVAIIAFIVAVMQLRKLQRSHMVQSQMNLINIENDLRKQKIKLKLATEKLGELQKQTTQSDSWRQNFEEFSKNEKNELELYLTVSDKLAFLINAPYLSKQFKDRDWEKEYRNIFEEVLRLSKKDGLILLESTGLVQNVTLLLNKWENKLESKPYRFKLFRKQYIINVISNKHK